MCGAGRSFIQPIRGEIAVNISNQLAIMLLPKAILMAVVASMYAVPAQAQMTCRIDLEITERARSTNGQGTITCDGQVYSVRANGVGGVGAVGWVKVALDGEVRNLRQASDIAGTYSGPGHSLSFGDQFSNLTAVNEHGVELVFTPSGIHGGDSLSLEALQISLE